MKKLKHLFILTLLLMAGLASCEEEEQQEEKPTIDATAEVSSITNQIEQNPNNPELYFNRANAYFNLASYPEAIEDLKTAIGLDSAEAVYYLTLSNYYLFSDNPRLNLPDSRKAIDVLNHYLAKYPEAADVHLEQAANYIYVDQYEAAIQHLNRAVQLEEYFPDAWFMRGIAYKYEGDTIQAIANFQKALEQDPEFFDAHMELGLLFSIRNNPLAEDYLENAIRIDSNDMEAYYGLALFYQNNNNVEKAKEIYRQIIRKDQNFARAFYNMGYIYNEQDSLGKAYRFFDIATQVEPSYADAYYMRGYVAEQQGDVNSAAIDYRQALNLEPEHALSIQGLERINENKE